MSQSATATQADQETVSADTAAAFADQIERARKEIRKAVVGQDEMVDLTLQCLFCHNHALLMGVPGLAKTLLVTTLGKVLGVSAARVQFTPDLMPSDITGTDIIQEDPETGRKTFQFVPGPIFANMLLADEINRTPPKTQAALLEAMQEKQVTVGTEKYPIEKPFFVLATQNPIEQEGTYNLPEAQLDRFMYLIKVDYPDTHDEVDILKRTTTNYMEEPQTVLDGPTILYYQGLVRNVLVRDDLYDYVVRLVQATRVTKDYALDYAKKWVAWGAGPRACQNLLLGGKVRAFMQGRPHVTSEDIQAVASPVLRHRVLVNYAAMAEGLSSDDVIERIVKEVPTPDRV